MLLGWVLAWFKSQLALSDSCGSQEQGVPLDSGRAVFTAYRVVRKRTQVGGNASGFPLQKGNPQFLIAEILWAQGPVWISPPGFLKRVPFPGRAVVVVLPHPPVQRGVRQWRWAGGPGHSSAAVGGPNDEANVA